MLTDEGARQVLKRSCSRSVRTWLQRVILGVRTAARLDPGSRAVLEPWPSWKEPP